MRPHFKILTGLVSMSVLALGISSGASNSPEVAISFDKDVKPIISNKCFKCHGPDAATVAANLRLDSFDSATADRGGTHAILPGKPEESRLIERVSAKDDSRMPPPTSEIPPLSEQEIDVLTRWIKAGAKYTRHWSLVPPKMPDIPQVSDAKWPRNDIDKFVLAKLESVKLTPNQDADKVVLMNRAYLSLIGLPPTAEQVKSYLRDTSPKAYDKLVDKLLADPRFGEHQARYWLDAVRYADTHGLHFDNERGIYPYRDWVVKAFNENLPFDKFTEWQIAGDLLPKPTQDELVATGFVRLNPTTNEGGVIEEEFLVKNTFDRVDTTSTVFLGSTIACAKCHDHKYDPFSQKDYYQLFAYFNSTTDAPLDGNLTAPPPSIPAPSALQVKEQTDLDAKLNTVVSKVDLSKAEAWLSSDYRPAVTLGKFEKSPPYTAKTFDEAYDTAYAAEPGQNKETAYTAVDLKPGTALQPVIAKENAAAYVRGSLSSPTDQTIKISVDSDDAIKVWLNGKLVHANKALRGLTAPKDEVTLDLKPGENQIVFKIVNAGGPDGLNVSLTSSLDQQIAKLHDAYFPAKDAKLAADVKKLYLVANKGGKASEEYRQLSAQRAALVASIPLTLIAQEMPKPRPAFVLRRGDYELKGDKVERGIPAVLGKVPSTEPNNRLGLAHWLVSKDNPLTARVFVNRVWQHYFGTGIVKTSEDFGSQGEYPSNLELLDYLAVKFEESGWDMKALHRMIATSAAFRQSSKVDAHKLQEDPENRLISRGPRYRLDAEVIRDRTLAASGLLVEELGGHGFKPYQPSGLWEALAFPTSDTAVYKRDKGAEIYRRSLYLFWKRTSPPPAMMAFDAPMREACTVRRSRTNTPLQALVTLNETQFFESARTMAAVLCRSAKTDKDRLNLLYLRTLGRLPNPKEADIMLASLAKYRAKYVNVESGAEGLLYVGDTPVDPKVPTPEYAAWTLISSTVMNTDEFLSMN